MATAKPYHIYPGEHIQQTVISSTPSDHCPGYAFVAYPNRDSSVYKERYNIPEAHTIIRGVSNRARPQSISVDVY